MCSGDAQWLDVFEQIPICSISENDAFATIVFWGQRRQNREYVGGPVVDMW